MLILFPKSDLQRHGQGHLERPFRRHHADAQGMILHPPCGRKMVYIEERENLQTDLLSTSTQYFYVEQYIYQVVIVLTKISIVLLYLVSPHQSIKLSPFKITDDQISASFQRVSPTASPTPAGQ
jgi:hypothetical protein